MSILSWYFNSYPVLVHTPQRGDLYQTLAIFRHSLALPVPAEPSFLLRIFKLLGVGDFALNINWLHSSSLFVINLHNSRLTLTLPVQ